MVKRMMEALSSCDVMALGRGNNLASSINSAFSFSRRDRAAFLLFSFIAQRAAERPGNGRRRIVIIIVKNLGIL